MSVEHGEIHPGISQFEIGSILNPENIFEVVHTLNTGVPEDEHVQIELYPTIDNKLLSGIRSATGAAGMTLPFPSTDAAYINSLQEKYPNTHVSRVHLPFTYDLPQTLIKPFAEVGQARARSVLWGTLFGSADNMRANSLATEIGADRNAHVNVIDGFAKANRLDELRQPDTRLYVENRTEKSTTADGIDVLDPNVVIENYIIPHHLDGLVLDYTHDPESLAAHLHNPLVQQHLRVVHFAARNHAMMSLDDPRIEKFAQTFANIPFAHDVTVTFDLNPRELGKLSIHQQVNYFERAMSIMQSAQAAAQVK